MIVAGFGFRASASVDSLLDAYAQATTEQLAQALATLVDKAESPAFVALAESLSLPIIAVQPQNASNAETQTNSPYSLTARATGSVAEATALAAVGEGAEILRTRVISHDRLATCALAYHDKEEGRA